MAFIIEFPDGLTKKVRGIYKIDFGTRWYIGKSKCVHSRLINHQKNINNLLVKTYIPDRFDFYRNVIKWIRFNDMEKAKAALISDCHGYSDDVLAGEEQFWIGYHGQFGECLNATQYQAKFEKIQPCLPNLTSLEGTTGPDLQ